MTKQKLEEILLDADVQEYIADNYYPKSEAIPKSEVEKWCKSQNEEWAKIGVDEVINEQLDSIPAFLLGRKNAKKELLNQLKDK